jgi:hypothetical protein
MNSPHHRHSSLTRNNPLPQEIFLLFLSLPFQKIFISLYLNKIGNFYKIWHDFCLKIFIEQHFE